MSEIHVSVGSYVVNALDDEELTEFEAHLATCEACRREVVEFSETAAQLSSITETAPPPALRGSILSAIQQVRPLPPEKSEATPPVPAPRVLEAGEQEQERDSAPAVVDELALRRQRRSTRILAFAVAAAMVFALVLGGWVVNLVQARQALVAESNLETQLVTAPDAKAFPVTMKNGGQATFVASKSLNKALFIGGVLPDPGTDKTYQLWTINGVVALPDALVPGGLGQKAWFQGSIASSDALAVTIEPSTGSSKPTSPVLASAML